MLKSKYYKGKVRVKSNMREKKERGKQVVCGAPAKADEML
jgi:hypothetical protein